MAAVGLIGTVLTALAFGIGTEAWGFVVLAAFVATLLGGLTVKFGLRRFGDGTRLNVWFVLAMFLPALYEAEGIKTGAWSQALAWMIGSAFFIAYTGIGWLARGRRSQPSRFPEIPGDTSPIPLTRPVIVYAVIRALALSIAVAIAVGSHQPNAVWLPIATLIAMKPSFQQSALVAEQRLAGAILGAALAALVLLTVHDKGVLDVIMLVLVVMGVALRGVNYAIYTAMTAAFVLIALDLGDPTNLGAEARRVLFTFAGVGIAVVGTFLANLLQKRTARATPQAT